MVVTDRDDVAEKVKALRSHGMTTLTWDRHKGHAFSYDVVALGNNYRLDEIRSALGLVQLHKLAQNNLRRGEISQAYRAALSQADYEGIEVPFRETIGQPSYHIFPILLPAEANRQVFMQTMRSLGVQTSIHYPPIHTFTYYRQRYADLTLPVTEAAAARQVTLPLYPKMTDTDVEIVLSAVKESLDASLQP